MAKNKPEALSARVTAEKYLSGLTKTTEISRIFCVWPKVNTTSTYGTHTSKIIQHFLSYSMSFFLKSCDMFTSAGCSNKIIKAW